MPVRFTLQPGSTRGGVGRFGREGCQNPSSARNPSLGTLHAKPRFEPGIGVLTPVTRFLPYAPREETPVSSWPVSAWSLPGVGQRLGIAYYQGPATCLR